ncbi:glutathione S-transferase family protein [Ruegeria marina]|uniref:Glutathione S-transferase n=1 Tax=Ruegeria marina TaxID=639004 RepID=A0A1G6IME7_9RHOB|nr:glutathione S-transferase family protein [Ruegeria marina]SDC07623.1 glutathione S-transferase [Ruegeria marina]
MKLYFAPNTRAVRIAWLLEELGLGYDLERFTFGDPAMRSPEYRLVHPLGRVPVLVDGDVTIFESGAIVEYVLARYGQGSLHPETTSREFPNYLQWLHFCEGMLMPPVNTIIVETVLLPPERRNEVNVKRAVKLLNQLLAAVDERLQGRDYLAGDFSGADIMTGHAVITSARLGGDFSDKPNLQPYADRLLARPALQKAMSL